MNRNLVFGGAMFLVGISSFLYSSWQYFFVKPEADFKNPIPTTASEYVPLQTINIEKPYQIDMVKKAFFAGQYAYAAQLLEEKKEDLSSEEYILLSQIQEKMGESDIAIQTIQKALPSSNPAIFFQWASLVLAQPDVARAEEIIKEFPESPEKYFIQTIINLSNQEYEMAQKNLEKIPNASVLADKKKAIETVFTTYESFSDGSPHFLTVMIANVLSSLEYNAIAIDLLKKTVAEAPEYRDAWIVMGNAYLRNKQFDDAQTMLEKSISLDPTHAQSPYLLGIVLTELQRYDEALDAFAKAQNNGYIPIEKIHRAKADIYLKKQQYQPAFNAYSEIINTGTQVSISDYTKAITLAIHQLNIPSTALELVQKAVQKNPENASLLAQQAMVMWKNGQFLQAKESLQALLIKYPEEAEIYLYIGQMAESQNEIEQAKESYKTCYEKGGASAIASECATRYNGIE